MSQNGQADTSEQIQASPEADTDLGLHEQTADPDFGSHTQIADTDTEPRTRTLTEKGKEYQISVLQGQFKSTVSSWRIKSNQLSSTLTDSNNANVIRNVRDSFQEIFVRLCEIIERLRQIKDDCSLEDDKLDRIEADHQQIMLNVSQRISELNSQKLEVNSIGSFRSNRSANTRHSNLSRISNASARKAVLQAKYKYIDIESELKAKMIKDKAELQKVQTMKEIEMVGAELNAQGDDLCESLEPNPKVQLPLIKDDSSEYVKEYVQGFNHPPCPIEVNVLVSESSVNPSNLHDTSQSSVAAVLTTTSAVNVTNMVQTSSVSHPSSGLNPNLPAFKPSRTQTSTQNTWVYNPSTQGAAISVPKGLPIDSHIVNLSAPVITTSGLESFVPVPLSNDTGTVSSITPIGNQKVSNSPSIEQSLLDLAKSLADQITVSRLPSPEPSIFSGDPLSYPSWKSAFQILIEQKQIPMSERLHYLRRYVSGPVKEVIEGYFLLSSDIAYEEAKGALDKRYGDPFLVANAFRDKLDNWPKISPKDGTGLRKFSDFLQQCQIAMQTTKGLNVLDDERENRKLLTKLPDWLITRWARIASPWKDSKGEYPPFKKFAEFIAQESKIACDPITSLQALRDSSRSQMSPNVKQTYKPKRSQESRSFLSGAHEDGRVGSEIPAGRITCVLCKKSHDLDDCRIFLAKSLLERKAFIKEKNLCFACFGSNHISKKCKHRKKCKVCSKFHPTSLHGDIGKPTHSKPNEGSNCTISEQPNGDQQGAQTIHSATVSLNNTGQGSKCSMIVPVYVSHSEEPNNERLVYALLDTQSDSTFILEETCHALGVKGTKTRLSLSTMYASDKVVASSKVKGLAVRGISGGPRILLPDTYTRDIMPANYDHIPTPEMARMWPHLEPIAHLLEPLQSCEIGILIGYNCPRALVPREVIASCNDEPYGQRTDLGWSIVGVVDHGCCENDEIGVSHRVLTCEVPPLTLSVSEPRKKTPVLFSLKTSVKEIMSSEVLGVLEQEFSDSASFGVAMSQQDKRFLSVLSQNICFKNGHYEMPLPFKGDDPHLPDNKAMVLDRLKSLKRRLAREDTFRQHYSEFMQELLRNGHAEKVPESEITTEDGRVWYIPHHGVYHAQKPDKIRVVFDCSAQFKGVCLNNFLLQGPDLTNKLVGVLCRFRKEPIAIMCDVEKMFYQFLVSKQHQDYLRFLWWDGEDYNKEPVVFRMKVHLFGATSSPGCSNFGFKRMSEDLAVEFGQEAANFIYRDFYVDDGLKSVSTVTEAIDLVDNTRNMCNKAGLRLHKFVSNSLDVIQHIEPEDRAKDLKDVDLVSDKLPVERVLGIYWSIESDSFQFKIVIKEHPLTRRGVLSSVCSMYDPLGFIAPIVLPGKQILQQLCANNADWDDPLPDAVGTKWENWCQSLEHLRLLNIERCVKPANFGKVETSEIHHFSDASSSGYGQCSYLRLTNQSGQTHCSLLMGKARVVPLKPITVPRLELSAALLSVKVGLLLDHEIEYENLEHIYWTDSKVVLGYLSNEARRFHVFVANRVQQIKDHTKISQWRYVDTKENPADLASRGVSAKELSSTHMWFKGPEFLWKPQIPTPVDDHVIGINPQDPEVKHSHSFAVDAKTESYASLLERIQYFSDWHRARKAVACCLRFVDRLRSRSVKRPTHVKPLVTLRSQLIPNYRPLTVDEIQRAEAVIIRAVQTDSFKDEIRFLESHKVVGLPSNKQEQANRHKFLRGKSQLQKLDPFLDKNGLLRVGGRIQNSEVSDMVKFPVVLPRKGHVTQLLIHHFHAKIKHQGRGITTQTIRSNGYWILGCSSAVSSHISKCFECRRIRSSSQEQKMADLPADRMATAPPFTYCAVDLFGPWYIKEGRRELKRYGVLFTCMACRAVHVETANSLSTDSFINCLRRFFAIRGPIRQLRSDRGSNFVGAERELRLAISELDEDGIRQFLLKENCDYFGFKMNVPVASHMGGIWERQIRSVRNVMSYLLHEHGRQLDDESLRTFLYEASAIVNSRPLSTETINDPLSDPPLSPNMLLTMKSDVILPPPGNFQKADLYCSKRWRRTQHLVNEFWKRWRSEYLQNLQIRSKWNKVKRNIAVGDIVLLKEHNLPRNSWRLCRVDEVTTDEDGLVRKAKVAVGTSDLDSKGKRNVSVSYLERPIHELILLKETEEIPDEEP